METTTPQIPEKLDFDKVWLAFMESRKHLEQTRELLDSKFQETETKWQETRQQFKEMLDKSSIESDKRFKETDRQMKNLMKKMSDAESRWGRFVESLVDGSLIRILKKQGIKVDTTALRQKKVYHQKDYEIDILAKNGKEIVVVEVKTTLDPQDVKHFIEKLKIFKEVYPEYDTNIVYGAVAYISVNSEANKFASSNGLLVIKATNDSARITNEKEFKPKEW